MTAMADIIGTASHLALLGKMEERSPRLKAKRAEFVVPTKSFLGFFYVCCALPISGV
jgi:hypothetical protein